MEHRCTMRRRHSCEVLVCDATSNPTRVRSGNISAGGVFVETDGPRFAPNMAVTVTFRLACGKRVTDFQLPAMVVRVTPRGAALMFLEIDNKTFEQLNIALRAIPKAAAKARPSEGLSQEADPSVRIGRAV